MIVYTALRSLVAGHSADEEYVLDVDVSDEGTARATSVDKRVNRSLGGGMEVIRNFRDVVWQITFEPVFGDELEQMREFLDSTDSGESFQVDLYGNGTLRTLRRTDEGHSETPFMRRGSEETDAFQISITAIEA